MRVFKLSVLFFIAALTLAGCNMSRSERSAIEPDEQLRAAQGAIEYDYENRLARENLDLQAIGELLEGAETAEEFEYRLNSPENGVNNLDLNGDGYADYISVREFDERDSEERGFSLFSMFGPEMIQEIATIIFDRDRYSDRDGYYPGSRVLITGNEQIYGDDYYYETNWLERSVPIVSWLFTDRDNYYNSPYYYENYPEYYEPYSIVETPVYRTRIEQYYNTPVFVQTAQPSITEIKIKSPYRGKSMDRVYSKMAKPTKQQIDFRKNNPGPPEFVREKRERNKEQKNNQAFKPEKFERNEKFDKPQKFDKPEKQEKFRPEKQQMREKPNKPEQRVKFERQNQVRIERQQQPNFERQKPAKFERQQPQPQQQQMKPQKQENRGNGGGNNKGGGNGGGGNGKGNGGGGGGKKGKG